MKVSHLFFAAAGFCFAGPAWADCNFGQPSANLVQKECTVVAVPSVGESSITIERASACLTVNKATRSIMFSAQWNGHSNVTGRPDSNQTQYQSSNPSGLVINGDSVGFSSRSSFFGTEKFTSIQFNDATNLLTFSERSMGQGRNSETSFSLSCR